MRFPPAPQYPTRFPATLSEDDTTTFREVSPNSHRDHDDNHTNVDFRSLDESLANLGTNEVDKLIKEVEDKTLRLSVRAKEKQGQRHSSKAKTRETPSNLSCFRCKLKGHVWNSCPTRKT